MAGPLSGLTSACVRNLGGTRECGRSTATYGATVGAVGGANGSGTAGGLGGGSVSAVGG